MHSLLMQSTGYRFTSASRSGWTLVELLVVLAILAVLVGLANMGVQALREASRRSACQNNLRQLGLALQAYEGSQRHFPSAGTPKLELSVQFWLLPFLEQQAVVDRITRSGILKLAPPLPIELGKPMMTETPVSVFECASDSATGGTNYRVNLGTGLSGYRDRRNRPHRKENGNGFFELFTSLTIADVSDGLSNTIAFSEKNRSIPGSRRRSADIASLPISFSTPVESFLTRCRQIDLSRSEVFDLSGTTWVLGGKLATAYDHITTPSDCDIDCGNWIAPDSGKWAQPALVRASSFHPSTVNCLYGDGSVRTTSNHVDRLVWRALGSRMASEFAP